MVTEFLTSILSGGATGLLGAGISRYADYKNKQLDIEVKKLDHENEIALRHIDERMMEKEWEARNQIALVEAESRMDVEDSRSFQSALSMEPKLFHNPSKLTRAQNAWMVFIDGVRGLIRPGLTLYLCAISTAVYMQAGKVIEQSPIPVESAVQIYNQISSTILYLTTTCVLFWFGSRVKSDQAGKKLGNN